MQHTTKLLANLKSNLLFLLSLLSLLALVYGSDKGLFSIALLVFVFCCCRSLFKHCSFSFTKSILSNRNAVFLAIAVEFSLLLTFYKNFTPGILSRMAQTLHIPSQWMFIALGLFFGSIGFYAAYILSNRVLGALVPFKAIISEYWKQILLLGILFSISICAIIRANFNYIDDLERVQQGYPLTGAFGRYISSFLATFLHANAYLPDISPLPQILAAFLMALSAVVLFAVITDNGKLGFWQWLALIPVGTFPFFLQCYSYKYDAPYMALSVLAAIAPLVYRNKSFLKFSFAVSVGTILVCTTYQSSAGILPIVTIAIFLSMLKHKTPVKRSCAFVAAAALGYVVGMIVFRFLIIDSSYAGYVNTGLSFGAILPNIKEYFLLISKWFSPIWLLLVIMIVLGFVQTMVQTTERNKAATLLISICAVVLMSILSFGAYILLTEPLFYPRGMYGFGIAIAIWCIQVSVAKKQMIAQASIALLSCCFFVFSFTYGNTLNMQKEYTQMRIDQVLTDIKGLDIVNSGQRVSVQVVGTIGHPEYLEGTFEEYPLLDQLVPVHFSDSSWYWGDYQLLHYTGLQDILESSNELDFTQYDLPVLIDNAYHTIKGNESYLLIELK